jgi:uncharacterized ParB-like nuclease family protein
MNPKSIKLDDITITGTQARAATNTDTVAEYAERMQAGDKFPPAVVFHDGVTYFMADGFHRYFACQACGFKDILADVRKGTFIDALKFALGANRTNGLQRTNADKRRAVEIALKNFYDLSDNALAELCFVSQPFVSSLRYQVITVITSKNPPPPPPVPKAVGKKHYPPPPSPASTSTPAPPPTPATRVGRDGKRYPAPPPPPPPKSTPPPPPAAAAVIDKIGRIIPDELVPMWERREELLDMIRQLAAIRRTIEDAVKTKDPLYADIGSLQGLMDYLTNARSRLKTAVPYTVCPTCQGKLKESCLYCCGTGFIGRFKWQSYPEDMKGIIFKTIKTKPVEETEE